MVQWERSGESIRKSLNKRIMSNRNKSTVVVGPIGIIDAALVRFLAEVKKNARKLLVHVTESLYPDFFSPEHLYGFLQALSIVDGIIRDNDRFEHMLRQPGTVSVPLPHRELRQYTFDRVRSAPAVEAKERTTASPRAAALDRLTARHGERKDKIGLVSGSFDLLHPGHVDYINAARPYVDILVAAAQSSVSIRGQEKNKDNDRPIYNEADRLCVLSALRATGRVFFFDEPDCKQVIRSLKPDVFIKTQRDMDREVVREECELVEDLGGEVRVIDCPVQYSSSQIIEYLRGIENNGPGV